MPSDLLCCTDEGDVLGLIFKRFVQHHLLERVNGVDFFMKHP